MKKNLLYNSRLADKYLEVMNFLNEISVNFPKAISFAPGRPDARFFRVQESLSYIEKWLNPQQNEDLDCLFNQLGQYNKTKGIVNEAIVRLLWNDEKFATKPEDILITDGAQEGMIVVIDSIFSSPKDVLLVSDLSYIGFVGYAKIKGVEIQPIKRDEDSPDLTHLEEILNKLKKQDKIPKILYEIPDFHNPTGEYMPLQKRKQLLDLAEKYDFYIVEDNPYGCFLYEGDKIPTLKALDKKQRVIYLGSFAKTIFPALRLGFIVADQKIEWKGKRLDLSNEMKKTKSLTTVYTSTLTQAIAGGLLKEHNYSLEIFNQVKVKAYKEKRDTMINALEKYFPKNEAWAKEISWNTPRGGFFLSLQLPFEMNNRLLQQCADKFAVVFCPMYFFSLSPEKHKRSIRLSFSSLSPKEIEQGIKKLAEFVKSPLDLS